MCLLVGASSGYVCGVQGMALGLMACVQLGKRQEFDKLWAFTRAVMRLQRDDDAQYKGEQQVGRHEGRTDRPGGQTGRKGGARVGGWVVGGEQAERPVHPDLMPSCPPAPSSSSGLHASSASPDAVVADPTPDPGAEVLLTTALVFAHRRWLVRASQPARP